MTLRTHKAQNELYKMIINFEMHLLFVRYIVSSNALFQDLTENRFLAFNLFFITISLFIFSKYIWALLFKTNDVVS